MAVIAGYALIFQNYGVMPYLMFSQEAMMLVMGLDEMKEERKKSDVFLVSASLFSFFVGISSFLS